MLNLLSCLKLTKNKLFKNSYCLITGIISLCYTANTEAQINAQAFSPSDPNPSQLTTIVCRKLHELSKKGIMFGHQDDLAYGKDWAFKNGKSDIKDVTGQYPAIYGWELGQLERDSPYNLDSVPFETIKKLIREGFKRKGIITISWHLDNPLNNRSAWDTERGAVASVLPGGAKNEIYKKWLDKVAAFMLSLKNSKGELIPVLFRPFHELTGNWFWWGKNSCTPDEFRTLWRFTVEYLRNQKNVHNLLYVYNTAGFDTKSEFMERYPGDDVVDMISFDSYQDGKPEAAKHFIQYVDQRLTILEELATEHQKLAALAETGYENIPDRKWWTQNLGEALRGHHISYVLVWRSFGYNRNIALSKRFQPSGSYFTTYPGEASENDFKKFVALPYIILEKKLADFNIYR